MDSVELVFVTIGTLVGRMYNLRTFTPFATYQGYWQEISWGRLAHNNTRVRGFACRAEINDNVTRKYLLEMNLNIVIFHEHLLDPRIRPNAGPAGCECHTVAVVVWTRAAPKP